MARLTIAKGAGAGEVYDLTKDQTILGRQRSCDVAIEVGAVSRQHARILKKDDGWYLEDLNSRNGTLVNGERLSPGMPKKLAEDDRVKICSVLLTFSDEAAPSVKAPELTETQSVTVAPEGEEGDAPHIQSTLDAGATGVTTARADVKLKAVLEIGTALGATLAVDELLPKILDCLFDTFPQADRGFIMMREDGGKRLVPKATKHRKDDDDESITISRTIVNRAISDRRAILSDDASSDSRFDMAQSIADFRIRSMMCVPLMTPNSEPIGIIQIDTQNQRARFRQDDLELLLSVASQASLAVENAGLHEQMLQQAKIQQQMEFAQQVQLGFLPDALPEVTGYEFFAHYESAYSVGGDYYDFLHLPHNRLAVVLGDVSGKGIAAALMMARLSSDVRFCTLMETDPVAAVERINTSLAAAAIEDRFVTFVLSVLDLNTHETVFVNAGHMGPLVWREASGQVEVIAEEEAGLPLGVTDEYPFEAVTTTLEPGDSVVVYTDGVSEAMSPDGELYTIERLIDLIKQTPSAAQALGKTILEDVRRHANGQAQSDDITLVCFGRSS